MVSKSSLLERLERLERASVSTQDAWWREMCKKYGFPVVPIDEATPDQRNAVMREYLNEFY